MASVLYLILLGIQLCVSNASILSRIVGGSSAVLGQFPWMVSLRSVSTSSHFCGGSFVTRQHVLTAAHCLDFENISTVFVVSGSISNIEGGENHAISHIRNHEEYIGQENYWAHDITVLRLTRPVELSAMRTILPLPTRDILHGESCVLSGWGRLHFPSFSLAAFLQYKNLNSLGQTECQAIWGDVISNVHLCGFSTLGEGACHGDSGSPLVCNGEQAGIASWVSPCANGWPDVYVRVYTYRDWILRNIDDVES